MKRDRLALIFFLLALPYPVLLVAYWLQPESLPTLVSTGKRAWTIGLWIAVAGIPVGMVVYPPFGRGVNAAWQRLRAQLRADRALHRELVSQIEDFPNPTAYFRLGLYWQEQLRWADSIPPLQRALELDANLLTARFRLGVAYFETEQYQEAAETFETVVSTDRSHAFGEAILRLARAQQESGHPEAAIEHYRDYLSYSGGRPEGCVRLAELLEKRGDRAEAKSLYESAIQHAEDAPEFTQGQDRRWARQAQLRLRRLERETG